MNTAELKLLVESSALIFGTLLLIGLARQLFDRSDDRAAGVRFGQVSPEEDAFQHALRAVPAWPTKHFVSTCMYCHHVTRSDAHPVRVGDELRVSHGICPRCMASKHPEVAHVAELAHA